MIVISSTCWAVCGIQSETGMPLSPYFFHFRLEASSGLFETPFGVKAGLILGGSGLPARWFTAGLGSNVSR